MSIYKNIIDFQRLVTTIPKNSQAYGYKYADMDTIWEYISEPLQKAGLCVVQHVVSDEQGRIGMRTVVGNEAGDTLESEFYTDALQAKQMNNVQALGASITYLRRYGISSMLSLQVSEDTDAATPAQKQEGKPKAPAKQPEPHKPAWSISDGQRARLFAIAKTAFQMDQPADEIKRLCRTLGYPESSKDLTLNQYEVLCENMQKMAEVKR